MLKNFHSSYKQVKRISPPPPPPPDVHEKFLAHVKEVDMFYTVLTYSISAGISTHDFPSSSSTDCKVILLSECIV